MAVEVIRKLINGVWRTVTEEAGGNGGASPAIAPAVSQLLGARGTAAKTSDLYVLDSLPKPIGPIGYALTGLAYDPTTGKLYGATSGNSTASPRSLISIDPATGTGTLIGAIGHSVSDIACNAAGQLYGAKIVSGAYQRLVSINKSTGSGSVIGTAPAQNLLTAAISFHPDGTLYLLSQDGAAGFDVKLYVVDPATGAVADDFEISTLTGSWTDPIGAISFTADGTLWVVGMPGTGQPVRLWVTEVLQDINAPNAVVDSGVTFGYDAVNGLDAIEWVPAEAFG